MPTPLNFSQPGASQAFEEATSTASLLRAWHRIAAKTPRARWSAELTQFEGEATRVIEATSRELRDLLFVPEPRQSIRIPKPSGGQRTLELSTVRDRIVERSLHDTLAPLVDPHLSPLSLAYRAGVGVAAVERVMADLRVDGYTHAVKADIVDCFGSIRASEAIDDLAAMVNDPAALALLRLLSYRVHDDAHGETARGLAQGSSLSPLLSNVYLDRLDRAVAEHGIVMVRYADDLLALTNSADSLDEAESTLIDTARAQSLTLSSSKVRKGTLENDIAFVGASFGAPEDASPEAMAEQTALYVGDRKIFLGLKLGRVEALRGSEVILSIPQSALERIVTFGPISVSAGVRQWALYAGVDWVCLSERGGYLGAIASYRPQSIRRRLRQDRRRRGALGRELARRFVEGKVANSKALLRRFPPNVGRARPPRKLLRTWMVRLDRTQKVGQLLGVEGAAAAEYWRSFADRLPPGTGFSGRKRRPPPDAVNAALSYGYAMLAGEATGAAAAAGLDPALGFLHRGGDGRSSLAYDLIEEFRPLIVDSIVMELARRRMLDDDFGAKSDDGYRLSPAGKSLLVSRYERRMTTSFAYLPGERRCTYRQALHLQAQSVARSVDDGVCRYRPVGWRS